MPSNEVMPTIAVVIPNHNDAQFLSDCLYSILNQSVQPDQIIFVDDCSSDDSNEVARKILESVPSAILRSNSYCMGTMATLNEGLHYATSDYVLFLSSNDYLGDGMIKAAKESMARLGRPGVWSALVWEADDNGNPLKLHNSPIISTKDRFFSAKQCISLAHSIGNWFTGTTMLFDRELLLQIGGVDPEYQGLADWLAALTVCSLRGAIFSPCPLGIVRNHSYGYLWRTLDNRTYLEIILKYMSERGPQLSPNLFTVPFISAMKNRIRYISLNLLAHGAWPYDVPEWQKGKYHLIRVLYRLPLSQKIKKLITFLLLRPKDIFPTLWYKFILYFYFVRRKCA